MCGRRYEAHVHGEVFEYKTLFCAKDGSCMNMAQCITEIEVNQEKKCQP